MRLRLGSDLQGSGRDKVNTAVIILIAVGTLVVGGILVTMGVAVEVIVFVTVDILMAVGALKMVCTRCGVNPIETFT